MQIVIELDYIKGENGYQYSTERVRTDGRLCWPACFCLGRKHGFVHGARHGLIHAVRLGPESEAYEKAGRSIMVIRPLHGCEEEVERFVAMGKLKNDFFPFLISEGGCDGDCD